MGRWRCLRIARNTFPLNCLTLPTQQQPFFLYSEAPAVTLGLLEGTWSNTVRDGFQKHVVNLVGKSPERTVEIDVQGAPDVSDHLRQLLRFLTSVPRIRVRLLNASDALRSAVQTDAAFRHVQFQYKELPPVVIRQHFIVVFRDNTHVFRITARTMQSEYDVSAFDSELTAVAHEHDVRRAILNLEEVSLFGSSGLASLARFCLSLKKSGGRAVVCSLQAEMRQLFQMAGMDRIMQVCGTEAEAVSAIS